MKELLLAGILSLAKAPAVDVVNERPRLETLAEDAGVVAAGMNGAPFRGEAAKEALGLALVAIAYHESDFRESVATCKVTGDRTRWQALHEGPSISLWQLRRGKAWWGYSRQEICTRQRLAAYLAAKTLGLYESSTKGTWGNWGALFRGYASDQAGKDTKQARARCKTWEKLAKAAGLLDADCHGRKDIVWATPKTDVSEVVMAEPAAAQP